MLVYQRVHDFTPFSGEDFWLQPGHPGSQVPKAMSYELLGLVKGPGKSWHIKAPFFGGCLRGTLITGGGNSNIFCCSPRSLGFHDPI